MPVSITCTQCKASLRVRDELAGKKVKCPKCAHLILVPAKEDEPTEVMPIDEERLTEAPRAASKKKDVSAKPAPAGATRRCPECGERIAATARKCKYCNAPVEAEDEDEDEAPEARRSKYKACPRCGAVGARRVTWTAWGSFYGPAMFTVVKCPDCGYKYNGRTGGSTILPAIIFVSLPTIGILGIIFAVVYFLIYPWGRSSGYW